ncbi:hypothetical protein ACFSFY_10285 [Sporosarcina siberiensis]|uniref:HTH domain-containing protein n=1 Tax=Sporosarcina siberiensis TaxID=1365606 RepID=A0ABW4SG38_9BACL
MIIKIAIIGPDEFCNRAEKIVAKRNDIELDLYRYQEPKESAQLIHEIQPCDVILFSGSLSYLHATDSLSNISIPVLYMKQDESAVAITLLHIALQNELDFNKISIDIREKEHIDHILKDLNETTKSPFVHLLREDELINEITMFHKSLSQAGKTDLAITSVHAVYEQLKLHNIPTQKIIDPESAILRNIEYAKHEALLKRSNSAQTAVGLVTVLKKSSKVVEFVENLTALLRAQFSELNGEYTIYTTMGNIEFALTNSEFLALFKSMQNEVQIAFGCGESIMDAKENAHFALNFNKKSNDFSFYVLDSNKKLLGPFPHSDGSIQLKLHDPVLVEMAKKTTLSSANISKLMTFSQGRQSKQFTTNDLSLHLNVSRRTAERTLKKLVECDYAKIVGEEMAYRQGRPRSLYELKFPIY